MTDGCIARVAVEMIAEIFLWKTARPAQEIRDALPAFTQTLAGRGQHFDAITSRNDQAFVDDFAVNESAQSFGAGFVRESQALAHRYGRGLVIESDKYD
jgi:hypothetical protein